VAGDKVTSLHASLAEVEAEANATTLRADAGSLVREATDGASHQTSPRFWPSFPKVRLQHGPNVAIAIDSFGRQGPAAVPAPCFGEW
jgi:hypothetical protein